MSAPLLIELFTEELPPKALMDLSEAFADGVLSRLRKAHLVSDTNMGAKSQVFATPRRLAVLIPNVLAKAEDRLESRKLMPAKVAFDAAGNPTTALTKRLEKDGVTANQLERKTEGSNEFVYLSETVPGVTLTTGLQLVLEEAIAKLPIPKVMSYQLANSTTTVHFVRPVHGLIALHGAEVMDVSVLGLKAGRVTHGHRFLGARDIELKNTGEYATRLHNEGKVIAEFDARRAYIDAQLNAKATELNCSLGDYAALLDEVTALVEWPVVYVAGFDAEFLAVPQECLILTMRTNQKYFPLFDKTGKLTERFLVVSNMEVADPVNIIEGNRRVVRPRLADARFFYEQDRKSRLETRVPALVKVVYHNKLGTQRERVDRIQLLAGKIARLIGADSALAERAALLAKADLLTGMVGEFPELQGIMGRYYAQHDGEPAVVADAIAEHYLPRFAGDRLPESAVACCVALADKLDTLIGIFGVGTIPTGDKDPFALRRHALGVIRILAERKLPLGVSVLLTLAHETFPKGTLLANHDGNVSNSSKAAAFVAERAKSYLRDRGYAVLEIESVLDLSPKPLEYVSRLEAARKFLALPEAAGLAEADKRIRNILSKSGAHAIAFKADDARLVENEEKQILRLTRVLREQVDSLVVQGKFSDALLLTAQLHQPVAKFFEKVMVNVEDQALRNNRFALLHEVGNLTNQVVNISKLAA